MHPELTQYLLYAQAMAEFFREPATTVLAAEEQQYLLKECLGLLRRAIATVEDAEQRAHLGQQLSDLKRLHYYVIATKRQLTARAIIWN